jgi:hypothetical protein
VSALSRPARKLIRWQRSDSFPACSNRVCMSPGVGAGTPFSSVRGRVWSKSSPKLQSSEHMAWVFGYYTAGNMHEQGTSNNKLSAHRKGIIRPCDLPDRLQRLHRRDAAAAHDLKGAGVRLTRPVQNGRTHNGTERMLLRGCALLDRVVDDEVEEEVVAAERAANFASALEMDEHLLVHELRAHRGVQRADTEQDDGNCAPSSTRAGMPWTLRAKRWS